ncbi:MAG: hypothetical protein KDD62_06045, partial [Bdellovibrionales bacterium]|nr:hypothetical protein [Bdellovibrionales bacterium]
AQSDSDDMPEDEEELPEETSSAKSQNPLGAQLTKLIKELVAKVQAPWVSSVLIIPSCDYLSLNVPLPFGDEKSINRVIDLEVQDLIPFSVDEFHVNHCVVSEGSKGEHDVHVGMMPRSYVSSIVRSCSVAGFEPNIISTNTSALAAMYHLAPDYMAKNSAVVYIDSGKCYICLAIDGRVKTDRIIFGGTIKNAEGAGLETVQLVRDLKLSITSVEKRYGVTIAKVYVVGAEMSPQQLQQSLGRSVEQLNAEEFIKVGNAQTHAHSHLVGLSAVFARDIEPPAVLSNFRSREFSYNPYMQQILSFGKQMSPYLMVLFGLIVLYFITIFGVRAYRISALESAISEEIRKVAPQLNAQVGEELVALSGENATLDKELIQLGSRGKLSPLDFFLELSKDLGRVRKRAPEVEISKVRITATAITLEGQATDYRSVNLLNKILEENKKIYCKIDSTTSGPSGNTKFKIDLTLCEL